MENNIDTIHKSIDEKTSVEINNEPAKKESKKYTVGDHGYITSFGDMTDREIIDQLIIANPDDFKGTLARGAGPEGYEMEKRMGRLREQAQQEKRERLLVETGKELDKSERLKNVKTGLLKMLASPVYTIGGIMTVLGIGHGVAHSASQATVGAKRFWSGITGMHFNEKDDTKWYNKIANHGI